MSDTTLSHSGAPTKGTAARVAPIVALLLVVAVLVPWRGAPTERLAALELANAVSSDVTVVSAGPDGATEEADERSHLASAILASRFVAVDEARGTAVLRLGEFDFSDDGAPADSDALASARRSFVQGLRQFAEGGFERDGREFGTRESGVTTLLVEGERAPVADGLVVRVRLGGEDSLGARRIEVEAVDGASGAAFPLASTDWREPTRFSLLPPVIAIALAIATRRPLISLFIGVLAGAVLVHLAEGAGVLGAVWSGAVDVPFTYLSERVRDVDSIAIILFVVFMLAMVGNTVVNGGIAGVMNALAKKAKDARSTQVSAYVMGLVIFFDDYANTVLVGSTMRSLTDKFKVAREKLAYIVDSTSAPVAGISILSTWIAFEVSTFASQLPAAGIGADQGYVVFLQTLPYRFYCVFTLVLLALIVFSDRDFGAMRRAEKRSRTTGAVSRPGAVLPISNSATQERMSDHVQPNMWRAILPIGGFIVATLLVIAFRGGAFSGDVDLFTIEGVTGVLSNGSGNQSLLIGGAIGFVLAALATIQAGIAREIPKAAWTTLKSMGVAFGILYSAWMVADVCKVLGTAPFLSAIVSDTIAAPMLPVVLVLLAGFVAFSTGSSWSTMGILLPMVVGVSYELGEASAIGGVALMVMCIGAVLEGSIFGDHCSPISDTTVLSSISSACDLMDHTRTQMPYAATAMGVSLAAGYVPAAFLDWSPYLCLGLGVAALVAIVFTFGRRNESVVT
jgi:Na+/H+ antiporter NhaC